MLRHFMKSFLFLVVGGFCLSLTQGYDNAPQYDNNPQVPAVSPGVSDPSSGGQVAYEDTSTPYPSRGGNLRMGNWDFHENWRYNRDAYYRGETQAQAYREEHPYGPEGIGYDAALNYQRNLHRLQELYQQSPTPENKERLEHYINPYHAGHYEGNFGEGSRNDDLYQGGSQGYYYNQNPQYQR